MRQTWKAAFALTVAAGVTLGYSQNQPVAATATLMNQKGEQVGTATFSEDGGVTIEVKLQGFTAAGAGVHGIHIHEAGDCGNNFMEAGGHYNPSKTDHGFLNLKGPHAGDLPNITIDEQGNATYKWKTQRISLQEGAANTLFDANGSALIIHAKADDYVSTPSGDSGDRIACGVIKRNQ